MTLHFTPLILALAWGCLLGLGYFGGLWWTVRRLSASASPRLLWLSSFALRAAVALAGFWLAARFGPVVFVAALAGFFAVRLGLCALMRPRERRA